jgi:hypothetical protein
MILFLPQASKMYNMSLDLQSLISCTMNLWTSNQNKRFLCVWLLPAASLLYRRQQQETWGAFGRRAGRGQAKKKPSERKRPLHAEKSAGDPCIVRGIKARLASVALPSFPNSPPPIPPLHPLCFPICTPVSSHPLLFSHPSDLAATARLVLVRLIRRLLWSPAEGDAGPGASSLAHTGSVRIHRHRHRALK